MIEGSHYPLLEHASECDGREFCTCEAVPLVGQATDADPDLAEVMVLYMEWCGECGAADFEVVGTI